MTLLQNTDDGAVANVDMRLNGCLWELKTINGAGGSLNARLDEAVSKWERFHAANMELDSKCRVVVDNRYGASSDECLLERIRHNIDHFEASPDRENIEEVLLISRGGACLE